MEHNTYVITNAIKNSYNNYYSSWVSKVDPCFEKENLYSSSFYKANVKQNMDVKNSDVSAAKKLIAVTSESQTIYESIELQFFISLRCRTVIMFIPWNVYVIHIMYTTHLIQKKECF